MLLHKLGQVSGHDRDIFVHRLRTRPLRPALASWGEIHLAATPNAGSFVSLPSSGRPVWLELIARRQSWCICHLAISAPLSRMTVLAGVKLWIVRDVDRGNKKAELQAKMASHGTNSLKQLPCLRLHRRHQTVAHFQAEIVKLWQCGGDIESRSLGGHTLAFARGCCFLFPARHATYPIPAARRKKENFGKPGIKASVVMTPEAIHSGRARASN